MTTQELRELLELLNEQRVTSFEHKDLKLTLIPSGPKPEKQEEKTVEDDLLFWSTK
jgi:hypothetical protein